MTTTRLGKLGPFGIQPFVLIPISLTELSRQTGLSTSSLSYIARGNRRPSPVVRERLSTTLRRPVETLFTREALQ